MEGIRRRSGSGVGRLAPSLALALAAGAALPAQALQSGTHFVAENRSVMFAIGGAIPGGQFRGHGVYEIDAPSKRISVRFTMPLTRTVNAVQLYSMRNGSPGTLRLTVYPDDPITAQPDTSSPLGSIDYAVQSGWQRLALPQPPSLSQGGIYHLVVAPAPGASPFDDDDKASYFTALSRFPVPYQPNQTGPLRYRSFLDLDLTLMYDEGVPPGLIAQWHPENTFDGVDPLYALECSDGSVLGWPYEDHDEPQINASNWYGQAIRLDPGDTLAFNYVVMFTRGRKATQTDRLFLDVVDADAGQTLASTVLIDPTLSGASLTINRSHWFGVSVPPLQLQGGASGRTYHLRMRGEVPTVMGARPYGYVCSLDTSSLDYPPDKLPTYRYDKSYAIRSTDSGAHFEALYDADTGFILAQLPFPSPIASYDEGGVQFDPSGPDPVIDDVRTAPANALLTFSGTMRNIGPVAGDLWFDLVNADTGDSVLTFPGPVIYPNVPPNRDTNDSQPATITFVMTTAPVLRIDVRLGHFAQDGTTRVLDDSNRFEIRRLP